MELLELLLQHMPDEDLAITPEIITSINLTARFICTFHSHSFNVAEEGNLRLLCKARLQALERAYSVDNFTLVEHVTLHVVDNILLHGPLSATWCWALERKNGDFIKTITNKKEMEITWCKRVYCRSQFARASNFCCEFFLCLLYTFWISFTFVIF